LYALDLEVKLDILLYFCILTANIYLNSDKNYFKQIQPQVPHYIKLFNDLIKKVKQLGYTGLAELLSALEKHKIPKPNDKQNKWSHLAKALRKVMQQQRDIGHEWNLQKAQLELIADYYRANQLLLDCLKLATVSNRADIKAPLFLPPPDMGKAN